MKHYLFSILIALVIWVVCMIPVPETPLNKISFIDKWTHFVMYATFTLTILFETYRKEKAKNSSSTPIAPADFSLFTFHFSLFTLIPIIMGCLVELAQAYLTTCRSGDWFDALCNALGSILGLGIFSLYMRFVQKKR